ncbi:MAG: peptide deformylase [Anaerolineae bacterium]|nr:peptide deformylase [Anaerolineales bacterium]MCQ3971924.1 peptide deformylase [Anaerolineae bacterium]
MAVRKVITLNDERLRQKAKKVKQFTPALKQLAEDMLETMRANQGVGLAGPQIGVMQRIFVAEIPASRSGTDEPHPQSGTSYILINPEIIQSADVLVEGREGCLSIPTWYGLVERPEWVEVRAQDLNGKKIKLKVDDLLARIFQHELDHLNGVLFIDHIKDREKLWQVLPEEETKEMTETAV